MWKAPHWSASRPCRASVSRQSTSTASSAPYCRALSGTAETSQQVSRPPEKAIPTRSPTGSERRIAPSLFIALEVVRERVRELRGTAAVAHGDEDRVVAGDRAGDLGQRRLVDGVGERSGEA